jgi:hypothetical protein
MKLLKRHCRRGSSQSDRKTLCICFRLEAAVHAIHRLVERQRDIDIEPIREDNFPPQ